MKVIGWPGSNLGPELAKQLGASHATQLLHRFHDGESLVRLPVDVRGEDVVFAAPLDHPDAKVLPLVFAADAARELGARRVVLAAPYLPYMRQDMRYHPREAVSSRTIAGLISRHFDSLVTVAPHLHRWPALDRIYTVPARAVPAAPMVARWIKAHIRAPLVVGPDAESAQWVEEVARLANAPHVVMDKERHGDRDVRVRWPGDFAQPDRTPVLVDDVVSTGRTLVAAASALRAAGPAASVAIAVHALFDASALYALQSAGIHRVVTCNTIEHATNAINVMPALAQALRDQLRDDDAAHFAAADERRPAVIGRA